MFVISAINRIRTAYRRIDHPAIHRGSVVVDIGSGGLPNPRADVACDSICEDLERDVPLRIDRPFVWANVECLPFRTQIFDYSIFSHVLEHVYSPKEALTEIQRVSKAGYIETPNSFYEFAIPHTYHVSRCTVIDGKLTITFKKSWDETLAGDLFADVRHDMVKNWWDLHNLDAKALLTIYRWKGQIDYEIHGDPDQFIKPQQLLEQHQPSDNRSMLRKMAIRAIRLALKPRKPIDLAGILVCPKCKGDLVFGGNFESAECLTCDICFNKTQGHLDFRL